MGAPQVGVASYYARHFTGRRMANGGRFDPHSDTIAHRTLPFGTMVRVTNLQNGLTATGVVQDRGPWTRGRIVDLSPRIARRDLDMMRSGVAQVEVVPASRWRKRGTDLQALRRRARPIRAACCATCCDMRAAADGLGAVAHSRRPIEARARSGSESRYPGLKPSGRTPSTRSARVLITFTRACSLLSASTSVQGARRVDVRSTISQTASS